ncbi:MAG: hypothetical protein II912_06855 [Clostridia bacterium]|nr:hypothetical protein [Clostridia bacterium]
MKTHIILRLGSAYLTLHGLLVFLTLAAFCFACLRQAQRKGLKRLKAVKGLCAGLVGMLVMGKLSYWLLDKNAVFNPLSGGRILFFALCGFFAGIKLAFRRAPKTFRRALDAFGAPFFALAAALYLISDAPLGRVTAAQGLFTALDAHGFSRCRAEMIQGALLCALMALAFALSRLPKPRFTVRFTPMLIMSLALVMPFEALKDLTQRRLLGMHLEAWGMLAAYAVLTVRYALRRLRESALPDLLRLPVIALPPLLSLICPAAVSAGAAWPAILLITLPAALVLSPLYPFVRRPVRPNTVDRKRKFT